MRILDTSQASATVVQPVKAETLNFLQLAGKNALADIVNALLGFDSTAYPYNQQIFVLYGCVITGTIASPVISPGAVFYQGEIFEVYGPAGPGTNTSFTNTGSNVSVVSIRTEQDTNNADPVTFSDLIQRNVHNIRTMQITSGPSGSGIVNLNSFLGFFYLQFSTVNLQNALMSETARAENIETSIITGVPGSNILNLYQITSQLTALQNAVGTVPNGTTVETQISDIGGGWQSGTPTLTGATLSGITNYIGWVIIGKTMHLCWDFVAAAASGPSFTLTLPSAATVGPNFRGDAVSFVGAGTNAVRAIVEPANTYFSIATMDGSNLPTTDVAYRGSLTIEIV